MNEKETAIIGTFPEIFPKLKPDTILSGIDIIARNEIHKGNYLRWRYCDLTDTPNNKIEEDLIRLTADYPLYILEGKNHVLYLAPRRLNMIFRNFDEAVRQLRETGGYTPRNKDITEIIESSKTGETLRVDLTNLRVDSGHSIERYFTVPINPKIKQKCKILPLNKTESSLVKKFLGESKYSKFTENYLNNIEGDFIGVHIVNPISVESYAKNGAYSCLCYIKRTLKFEEYISLHLNFWGVDHYPVCLYGEPKKVLQQRNE